jgi:hypothetical protein
MISTRDLSLLPDVDLLGRTVQSMALLDAILSPEWPSTRSTPRGMLASRWDR